MIQDENWWYYSIKLEPRNKRVSAKARKEFTAEFIRLLNGYDSRRKRAKPKFSKCNMFWTFGSHNTSSDIDNYIPLAQNAFFEYLGLDDSTVTELEIRHIRNTKPHIVIRVQKLEY